MSESKDKATPRGKVQRQLATLHQKMGESFRTLSASELAKQLYTNPSNANRARQRYLQKVAGAGSTTIAPQSAAGRALGHLTVEEERLTALVQLIGLARVETMLRSLRDRLEQAVKR